MNRLIFFLIGMIFISNSLCGQFGKAVISEQICYEETNIYFPHDFFIEELMGVMLDTAVSIHKINGDVIIKNNFNDGFVGYKVIFVLSSNLEIKDVKYMMSTDVIDGSTSKYTVEKVILSMNTNPFYNDFITGHYTLQIKEDYFAGDLLKFEGVKDTTSYFINNGKFKIYSDIEKKQGKDWVISQNEIAFNIKDSLGVYRFPDKFAQFKHGKDSLRVLLSNFEIDRSETELEKKVYVTLKILIDENGIVDSESMQILEPMKSDTLIGNLRKCEAFMSNWFPAQHNENKVKSRVNLIIFIKE